MPVNSMRGCGMRAIGATYLCGSGLAVPCASLPLFIDRCEVCGYEIPFTRAINRLNPQWIQNAINKKLAKAPELYSEKCKFIGCPICYPLDQDYGLMWVGESAYTPQSFIREAARMGVSKRIGKIPKWLKLGETWVLLAYKKYPVTKPSNPDNCFESVIEHKKAVFYVFLPDRVEMPILKESATKGIIEALKDQGITAVVVDENTANFKERL